MLPLSSNPTSLLRKYIKIHFDDVDEIAYVQDYNEENNCLEVMVNPTSEYEFYAELYLEDNPESWYIVDIVG